MKPQKILEVLETLDPSNDEHWTAEGLPRTDAVGEGVSRGQIQSAAPHFTRKNAKLPEPVVPEKTLEEELFEIQAIKDEAEKAIRDAVAARAVADAKVAEAEARLDKIRAEELAKETRSDTEINMDYLRSEFQSRLARAGEQKQIRELLLMSGLNTKDVRMLTGSVLDRKIAAQVINGRRK
jgi:vacuolar-type H+-ATPase subunit I/STV1